ncbi:MAG TPA: hypothetical protein ENN56_02240 [Firmicutes bacterium]|nr:hypothetical protein [Bacillota bacterium]
MAETVQALRAREYLTTYVRIGYELVLIVSGPTGEVAVIDLSHDAAAVWRDAWAGMRKVLPRMPVVAVVCGDEYTEWEQEHAPVISVSNPESGDAVVQAVEKLLKPETH